MAKKRSTRGGPAGPAPVTAPDGVRLPSTKVEKKKRKKTSRGK